MKGSMQHLQGLFIISCFWCCDVAARCGSRDGCFARAGATLSFDICQDNLFLNHCQVSEDLDPDGVGCVGFTSSCEYMKALINRCGHHYVRGAHSQEEYKLLLKMWLRQFFRDFLSKRHQWEDGGAELEEGRCDEELLQIFTECEIEEIHLMLNSSFEHTSAMNLKLPFDILVLEDGSLSKVDGYENQSSHHSLPSDWEWCNWKLNSEFRKQDLSEVINYIYRCDGKCNRNTGDNQLWYNQGQRYVEFDLLTKTEGIHDNFEENGELFRCYTKARSIITSQHIHDEAAAKGAICGVFQFFLKTCSRYIDRCIGTLEIKEVVVAEFLQMIKSRSLSDLPEKYTKSFTFRDCKLFNYGGVIEGNWTNPIASLNSLHDFGLEKNEEEVIFMFPGEDSEYTLLLQFSLFFVGLFFLLVICYFLLQFKLRRNSSEEHLKEDCVYRLCCLGYCQDFVC